MAGDPSVPCIAVEFAGNLRFDQLHFEMFRAYKAAGIHSQEFRLNLGSFLPTLAAIAEAATKTGRLKGFEIRLTAALKSLRDEFGFAGEAFNKVVLAKPPELWVSQGAVTEYKTLKYRLQNIRSEFGEVVKDGEVVARVPRQSMGPMQSLNPGKEKRIRAVRKKTKP